MVIYLEGILFDLMRRPKNLTEYHIINHAGYQEIRPQSATGKAWCSQPPNLTMTA